MNRWLRWLEFVAGLIGYALWGGLVAAFCLLSCSRAKADAADAVVPIPSHGWSGTVIEARNGRSLILSCGHGWDEKNRNRPIVVDAPSPSPTGAPSRVGVRLLDVDYRADLSLIELGGELPYV